MNKHIKLTKQKIIQIIYSSGGFMSYLTDKGKVYSWQQVLPLGENPTKYELIDITPILPKVVLTNPHQT